MAASGPTDILLILAGSGRDAEWETQFLEKTSGKVEVRWECIWKSEGVVKKTEDFDPKIFDGVTMLYTYSPIPVELVPKLRFVQLSSSGSDLWANHPKFLDKNVVFCTTSGSNAPQISEWVLGTWLRFQHSFPRYEQLQAESTWSPAPASSVEDSVGLRVGIIGYGAIGRQVARVCNAIGMEVVAYTSTPRLTPESRRDRAFITAGMGDPEGTLPARWYHGTTKDSLNEFLAQGLDLLVLCLPLTKATQGLIGKEQFAILGAKKTFFINIARGPIVDQEALVEALENGQVRGAALDVTDPEPLPASHPLWKAKNCFITPHVAWHSSHQQQRCFGIMADNIQRFLQGEPLTNQLKR